MTAEYQHRFVAATRPGRTPLLMLHGTGGDETDLIGLGRELGEGAALLSPRGKVTEHGMPRFFSRLGQGVFDPVEVRYRARELAGFVAAACARHALAAPIAIGFSNGANVAAAILALRPAVLAGAVLLRPMVVLDDPAEPLGGRPVLILSGASDPVVPPGSAERLADLLRAGGATVDHRHVPAGHGLVGQDLSLARAWLARVQGSADGEPG